MRGHNDDDHDDDLNEGEDSENEDYEAVTGVEDNDLSDDNAESDGADPTESSTPNEIFANPLELIDPDADLDVILGLRSIGEAIQLLSPDLPGAMLTLLFFE